MFTWCVSAECFIFVVFFYRATSPELRFYVYLTPASDPLLSSNMKLLFFIILLFHTYHCDKLEDVSDADLVQMIKNTDEHVVVLFCKLNHLCGHGNLDLF